MDIPEVGWSGMALAQGRDRCQAIVKRVINLRVP
jgi:hypothetical protein